MLILLDNGPSHSLARCESELGMPVGQLLTPLTRYRLKDHRRPWAIDNGAFSDFDERAFFSLLGRCARYKTRPIFVSCPDQVGNAEATRELFERYYPKLWNWPIAFVLQDGQESAPPIPWDLIACVFVGGSNKFKESRYVLGALKIAKQKGKWCHMGRVNGHKRLHAAIYANVDSIDGTGISRYTHMRTALRDSFNQKRMFP